MTKKTMIKFNIRKAISIFIVLISITGIYGCQTLKQIADSIVSLQKIQFKLDNISNFRLMGVDLAGKSSASDFGLSDAAKFASAIRNSEFPVDFVLNVAANNPNTGNGNAQQSLATLTSLDWKLYIDDTETIGGNIGNSITIPASGQQTIIPLSMNLDLLRFFSGHNLENMLNLALALGGNNGSAARLKLDAKPTIQTPLGPITYPSRINIVNTEFRG